MKITLYYVVFHSHLSLLGHNIVTNRSVLNIPKRTLEYGSYRIEYVVKMAGEELAMFSNVSKSCFIIDVYIVCITFMGKLTVRTNNVAFHVFIRWEYYLIGLFNRLYLIGPFNRLYLIGPFNRLYLQDSQWNLPILLPDSCQDIQKTSVSTVTCQLTCILISIAMIRTNTERQGER